MKLRPTSSVDSACLWRHGQAFLTLRPRTTGILCGSPLQSYGSVEPLVMCISWLKAVGKATLVVPEFVLMCPKGRFCGDKIRSPQLQRHSEHESRDISNAEDMYIHVLHESEIRSTHRLHLRRSLSDIVQPPTVCRFKSTKSGPTLFVLSVNLL